VIEHGLDDSESIPDQDTDISFLLHHAHTGSTSFWSVKRLPGILPEGTQPQGEVDYCFRLVQSGECLELHLLTIISIRRSSNSSSINCN